MSEPEQETGTGWAKTMHPDLGNELVRRWDAFEPMQIEIERLRAALRPFAELHHDPMTDGPNVIVPAGWLRDAHHALEDKT